MKNRVPQNINPNFNPINQMGAMLMRDKYDVSDKLLHIEDHIINTY